MFHEKFIVLINMHAYRGNMRILYFEIFTISKRIKFLKKNYIIPVCYTIRFWTNSVQRRISSEVKWYEYYHCAIMNEHNTTLPLPFTRQSDYVKIDKSQNWKRNLHKMFTEVLQFTKCFSTQIKRLFNHNCCNIYKIFN